MNNSELIQPHHMNRKAVIYIRQSTGHQVLTNVESQKIQRAIRENARRLGWGEGAIEVVETDMGVSAKSTECREGYKRLLNDVALGRICLEHYLQPFEVGVWHLYTSVTVRKTKNITRERCFARHWA